jgi:hypothetical protein
MTRSPFAEGKFGSPHAISEILGILKLALLFELELALSMSALVASNVGQRRIGSVDLAVRSVRSVAIENKQLQGNWHRLLEQAFSTFFVHERLVTTPIGCSGKHLHPGSNAQSIG